MKRRYLRLAERYVAIDQLYGAYFVLRANGANEGQARRIVALMARPITIEV